MTTAEPKAADGPAMLDVKGVARLLGCSPRHVNRLSEAGRMPDPVKLGALVRWDRAGLARWIAAGCPAVRANGPYQREPAGCHPPALTNQKG